LEDQVQYLYPQEQVGPDILPGTGYRNVLDINIYGTDPTERRRRRGGEGDEEEEMW
jgi:hypothetical protein